MVKFSRIIFLLFFIVLPLFNIVAQEIVSEILVEGNINVSDEEIKKHLLTKPGKEYVANEITQDIYKLYELGYFSEISAEFDRDENGIKVIFLVKEKPKISRIDFKGNQEFSAKELKKKIEIKEGQFIEEYQLQQEGRKILEFYKEESFTDTQVETYLDVNPQDNLAIVTFFITEGNRVKTSKIKIEGNMYFAEKKILGLLETKEGKYFKQDVFNKDLEKIEKFYKDSGFIDVKITTQFDSKESEDKIEILIKIEEGSQYKIKQINFVGNTVFSEQKLKEIIEIKENETFNQEKLDKSIYEIANIYNQLGYLYAIIEPKIKKEEDNLIIDFNIVEGEIVYVNKVYVEGNNYTLDEVILREILLEEGKPFDSFKLGRSQEKIYNLGFFSNVQINIEPVDSPYLVDVIIIVEEQKTGMASMGAGYSSVDRLLGNIQISQINLFGKGQRLDFMWEFGERKQSYEVTFIEPWLLGYHIPFNVNLHDTVRKRDYFYNESGVRVRDEYNEGRRGGNIGIGKYLTDILSVNLNYSYERIEISQGHSDFIKQQEGVDRLSSISTYVIRDNRDNIFDASRGSRQTLNLQSTGGILGGNNNFIKTQVSGSWFFPSWWKFVFGVSGRIGFANPFGSSTELPIYERFYVGGAESVRGYEYRGEIGPPEGGNVMTVLNLEYKFPLIQQNNQTVLQGAFFIDIGGLWRDLNDFKLVFGQDEDNLKAGVGFGIRIVTPVFPIRIDWGYGLNHRIGERVSQWHFTIGQLF